MTLEDLNMKKESTIALPVIIEGNVLDKTLKALKVDEMWLNKELVNQGIINKKEVFYASLNPQLQLHISLIEDHHLDIPPILN